MDTIRLSICNEEHLINSFVFFIAFLPAKQNADLAFVGIDASLNDQDLSTHKPEEIMKTIVVQLAFLAKAEEHAGGSIHTANKQSDIKLSLI